MSIANWILTCTRPKFADLFGAFFALYLAYWRTGRVTYQLGRARSCKTLSERSKSFSNLLHGKFSALNQHSPGSFSGLCSGVSWVGRICCPPS